VIYKVKDEVFILFIDFSRIIYIGLLVIIKKGIISMIVRARTIKPSESRQDREVATVAGNLMCCGVPGYHSGYSLRSRNPEEEGDCLI